MGELLETEPQRDMKTDSTHLALQQGRRPRITMKKDIRQYALHLVEHAHLRCSGERSPKTLLAYLLYSRYRRHRQGCAMNLL